MIYGAKGWIGQQFISILSTQKIDFMIGKARLDHETAVECELDDTEPTHVASFFGRTHGRIGNQDYTTIDYLEQPGKLVEDIRDNLFLPMILAIACVRRSIHYTYLGTGCIFTFDDEHLLEDSLPNFFESSYSIVKGFTDRLMHLFENNVVRIRMPITAEENPRNFIIHGSVSCLIL